MVQKRKMPIGPIGGEKTLIQALLERGADLLQPAAVFEDFNVYVTGFHCAKGDPTMQMEAHHFCRQVNEDFIQCILFDGNTEDANLVGIEYIISEKLMETMPEDEIKYWHPHNFEILSGQLIGPGLPAAAEKAMLRTLMNSYGKTYHLWYTGRHDGKGMPGHTLPMGDPTLMWSFNRYGEADPDMLRDFEQALNVKIDEKRDQRKDLMDLAHPQHGVDDMKGLFPNSQPTPGIEDIKKV